MDVQLVEWVADTTVGELPGIVVQTLKFELGYQLQEKRNRERVKLVNFI